MEADIIYKVSLKICVRQIAHSGFYELFSTREHILSFKRSSYESRK